MITQDDIAQLGTILGIWAHPDDEAFTMGGLLAAAAQNGQNIIIVTATRGEGGVQDESRWPARELGKIREAELLEAYKILGIDQHHYLDYIDGSCADIPEDQAVQRLVSLIETYKPDSIFTFGPDGLTGHPDHQAVSRWTRKALASSKSYAQCYHPILTHDQYEAMREADEKFNFFFNVDKPRTCEREECAIYAELDDTMYDRKMRALAAMPSQYEAVLAAFGDTFRPSLGTEAFVTFSS